MSNGKPFEPGNNFGRGRPKGSKNRPENKGLALIKEHERAIVSKVIADGLRGDKTSKVILMRAIERKKPAKFDLGPTNTPAALLKAYDKTLRAFSKRKITAADGQVLSGGLSRPWIWTFVSKLWKKPRPERKTIATRLFSKKSLDVAGVISRSTNCSVRFQYEITCGLAPRERANPAKWRSWRRRLR
jgi:hypothetical protein